MASKAIRQTKELKNLDTVYGPGFLNATYLSVLMNPVTQGSNANERTGRQIRVERIRLALTFGSNTAAVVLADAVRYVVFLDRESRGGAALQADVLQNIGTQAAAINSSYDADNVPARFKILSDGIINLVPRFSGQVMYESAVLDIPVNAMIHYYNTSAGTIADIEKGAIYVFFMGTAAANFSTVAADVRLWFRDV
jgi:hypothetical protein